uniref:Large ribosomal subunit protein uL4m n=1 Tax=Haptolina brevifila TaxID=156173 RepID=A0A7S2MP40_9EUKA|mmetsp:Transcript_55936/g.111009  ORF Transcript_55936/g.111009 Transcript_55936/m.111009 type:complete len:320 (+) Transcript_55936:75-1034(+)
MWRTIVARRPWLPPSAGLARRCLAVSVTPQELRRPFQQKNRRRDDVLVPRMPAAVPECTAPFVQAWLSAWDDPRAGIAQLRSDVWAMPLRTDIVHRVVTWQRACMRQGTSKTKGRNEKRGGGKKPRPQKGSGRSRQGSIRSPLFRGGGDTHPKRPRDFSYKLNLKVQTLGLKTALSDKYRRGALLVMKDFALAADATGRRGTKAAEEELGEKLCALGVQLGKQTVMLVVRDPRTSEESAKLKAASEAHEDVLVVTPNTMSTLDIVTHTLLMVSLDALEDMHANLGNEHSKAVGHVMRLESFTGYGGGLEGQTSSMAQAA